MRRLYLKFISDRRGESDNMLENNTFWLILIGVVILLTLAIIYKFSYGAALWEEYYASEISRVVNMAHPGEEFSIDVSKAYDIAIKKRVKESDIFQFDNAKNLIYVRLTSGNEKTAFGFFSDVDVINWKLIPPIVEKTAKLKFKVVEAQK